ncbi:UvrD-helicase domain-containing protein [Agrobacterium tumefaciens]|uniref:UvrD-helicase domain-containing protein n=1 Tax=Agrobacterium tumefaciens TaxID=358 RepID=UPI0010D18E47|nr:UvrD-helicase domain-containing protein [Agrobacterium tumefaciens]TCV46097.1 AAA domain-containing protein [Agrobacterium tumefaciens]
MIPFEIEDDDIRSIEGILKCDFSSQAQREALKARASIDIQAAPGSGKTTLLVAKLAILSQHWPYAGQGICVLSHTNVAREEIEKKLALHPTAMSLLAYPHFIGTIQSFAHQFLALPYLRGLESHPRIVDDSRFAAAAWRAVKTGKYWYANNHLENHGQSAEKLISTLRFSGPDLNIVSDGVLPAPETKTFESFSKLKLDLADDGIFRFDDMLAIAQKAMQAIPSISEIVSARFPVVFFDEMQDTDDLQEKVIRAAFGDRSAIQRFGDRNQGIFDDDRELTPSSFPKQGYVDLASSRRFGSHVAAAASTLTIAQPQTIAGNPDRAEKRHTILLFDDASIKEVLPAFGRVVLEQFADDPSNLVVKAIGCRKTGESQTLPRHIGDYWDGFEAAHTNKTAGLSSLIGYVRRARALATEHGNFHAAAPALWDGVFAFLHSHNCRLRSGEPFTKKALIRQLEDDEPGGSLALQRLVRDLCLDPAPGEAAWGIAAGSLVTSLRSILPESAGDAAEEFLIWNEEPALADAVPSTRRNVFEFADGERRVNVSLNTIHGVKGETHNATLVLTTSTKRLFDLKEALPLLSRTGKMRAPSSIPKLLMTLFVGITRPKDLLCLAIPGDHCNEKQCEALISLGWNITDLRAKAETKDASL